MRRHFPYIVTLVGLLVGTPAMAGVELITNGGFETGDSTGWIFTGSGGSGNRGYVIGNGANAPVSGYSTPVLAGGGNKVAITDQTGAGIEVMIQSFVVPTNATKITLSYDFFESSHTGQSGTALNGTTQIGRIDLLTAAATTFDTSPGSVLDNLFTGTTNGAWQYSSFDITSMVSPGGTFQLRFATDTCCFYQEIGADNVSIVADVPEPTSLALLGGTLVTMGSAFRRRR